MAFNKLLFLTAVIEATTGLALIIDPPLVVRLLLGSDLAETGVALGRVAGFGLLSLGLACWPVAAGPGARAPALRAMLTYNVLVTIYLLSLGIGGETVGSLLWPAVALHAVLTLLLARAWLTKKAGSFV
jgi:hypothetical protein